MNRLKSNPFLIFLSYLCAIGVFFMSIKFQEMAYWGNNLTWYWVGVTITYILFFTGMILLKLVFTRKSEVHTVLKISTGVFSGIFLILGILWTTFIVIAGMSGI